MLFNGKFWNKPGHLGMTRAELKDALQALPKPEAGDAGKAVLVNADADGYELGEAGGGTPTAHKVRITISSRNGQVTQVKVDSADVNISTILGNAGASLLNNSLVTLFVTSESNEYILCGRFINDANDGVYSNGVGYWLNNEDEGTVITYYCSFDSTVGILETY